MGYLHYSERHKEVAILVKAGYGCPAGTLFFRGERIQCPVFCITLSKGGRSASSKLTTKEW
jgi:hypothetical protein